MTDDTDLITNLFYHFNDVATEENDVATIGMVTYIPNLERTSWI